MKEKDQPDGNDFWVNGIVAARDLQPYIQISTSSGMKAQLTIGAARKVAHDIVTMCSRTEADAMLLKFFDKAQFPAGAGAALMQEFREFRHELDMERVEGKVVDPDTGEERDDD